MARHDHLRHGGHAGRIAADILEIAVFGLRLERRPRAAHIHAVLELDILLLGDGGRLGDQLLVVAVVHIRKAGTEFGDVGADQRIGHQVDMVGDDHQVADAERGVDAARSVRYKEVFDAELPHDAHRERHLLHAVAFVIVETALHGHDPAALDHAENHTAFVSFDRGDGESRNILVFDGEARLDLIGEAAQTGAEDDAHFGSERVGGGVDESRRFFNFL